MSDKTQLGYSWGRMKPSAFKSFSPRCEGPQTHLNPGALFLIAFDVHVNMTCFNIPSLTTPSSEDQGKAE